MTEAVARSASRDAIALAAGRAPLQQMKLVRFDEAAGLLQFQLRQHERLIPLPLDRLTIEWDTLSEEARTHQVDSYLQVVRVREELQLAPPLTLDAARPMLRPLIAVTDQLLAAEADPQGKEGFIRREIVPTVYSVSIGFHVDGFTMPAPRTALAHWRSTPEVLFDIALENLKTETFQRIEQEHGLIWLAGHNAASALMEVSHWLDVPDRGALLRPVGPDLLLMLPIYPWTPPALLMLMYRLDLDLPGLPPDGDINVPVWCSPDSNLERPAGLARTPCGERFYVPGSRAMRLVYRLD